MIIVRGLVVDVKEEFLGRVFGMQRATKDAHDLNNRSVELDVVLDDSHEAVGDDDHMYLNADNVLRFVTKGLDSEVLLNPFKEEFDLPSISVQTGDILGRHVEVVGVVGKKSKLFENETVSDRVRLREQTSVGRMASKLKKKRFVCMDNSNISEFLQASISNHLTKYQYLQLIPRGEGPSIYLIIVYADQSFEVPLGKKFGCLHKNKVPNTHIRSSVISDTMIRNSKVRQDFYYLKFCA